MTSFLLPFPFLPASQKCCHCVCNRKCRCRTTAEWEASEWLAPTVHVYYVTYLDISQNNLHSSWVSYAVPACGGDRSSARGGPSSPCRQEFCEWRAIFPTSGVSVREGPYSSRRQEFCEGRTSFPTTSGVSVKEEPFTLPTLSGVVWRKGLSSPHVIRSSVSEEPFSSHREFLWRKDLFPLNIRSSVRGGPFSPRYISNLPAVAPRPILMQ